MKIEVDIRKKPFFGVLAVLLVVLGVVVVYAVAPNPGHDANQVGYGTFSSNGCPGGNPANCIWVFPGQVGIGIADPKQSLHIRANDAVIFQGTEHDGARTPSISLKEDQGNGPDARAQHWEIIKRGSTYSTQAGQADSLLLAYYTGNAWQEPFRLNPDGSIYFENLKAPSPGQVYYLCIDDKGKVSSSASACGTGS